MKRIFTLLLSLATLLAVFPYDLNAQRDSKASDQRLMMTSDRSRGDKGHMFVIEGQVALDIPDSCYNIYITDIDKEITSEDFVACVPIKNKRFRFETELNTIKLGRIRAIMPGNKLCSAWIHIFFIPGFTVDMKVNNGYYDIFNKDQYDFMTNAWLNKDALAVLFESMGARMQPTSGIYSDMQGLQTALMPYNELLAQLQAQFNLLKPNQAYYEREIRSILKRMEEVNAQMQTIINKYADSLQY